MAWIFSRGNTGPMSIKSESSKVHCDLLERDCGRISRTMEEKGKTSSSTTILSVSLLFFSLSSGYFSSVFFLLVSFLPPGRDRAHGWPHALGSRYCFSITVAYGPLLPITTTQSQISVIKSPQPYGQSTLPLHSLLKIMALNAISITVPSIITQKLHKINENVLNNQSLLSKYFTFRHLLN